MSDPDGQSPVSVDRQIFLNFVNNIENVTAFTVHLLQNAALAEDRAAGRLQLLRLAFTLGAVYHHYGRIDCREGSEVSSENRYARVYQPD